MNHQQFYIRSSNSLSALADQLTVEIARQNTGLFMPVRIVTQTEGMNNWLKEKMALKNGIAANLEFLRLNDLLYQIFKAAGGTYQKSLSADDLSWLIYDLMGDDEIKTTYPQLAGYYQTNNQEDNLKKIELAKKISDLLDQYQAYRPEIIEKWNKGELYYNDVEEEKWQKDLWIKAREKAGNLFPDKSVVKKFIIEKINDPTAVQHIRQKIPNIFIFGTVLLTEYHRDLLYLLSGQLPVFIFLPNPSPEIYWYEDQTKKEIFYQQKRGRIVQENPVSNPLLLNWGKLIQNTIRLLFENDEVINQYDFAGAVTFQKDTLLHAVQHYISENSIPQENENFSDAKLNDGSILIQSCHSPIREVQSLYNYLVHLADKHPGEINARDIVVQVTDINRYASFIRAVFDNAPYKFPYKIADETFISSDSVSRALAEVLTLDENHFTSETVMQLLDYSCIKDRFQIYDPDNLRRVVNEANIRYGIDGKTENDSIYVSWNYGLKRIMYGLCISGGEEYGEGKESFFPLDTVEGSSSEEVIHFACFADTLIALIKEREKERTVSDWLDYVFELTQKLLFNEEDQDSEEYRQLISVIEKASATREIFDKEISYYVFLKQFLSAIGNAAQEYHFARGGVTFCSTIPMRSIPFKVVAMLGLDFDKFPRKNTRVGFDLMIKKPRKGDRDLKVNDKHLFLETIMSAGDFLYLSYNGQDIQTNAKKPPSILVDELLNFFYEHAEHSDEVENRLVVEQPLHTFSRKYGTNDKYYNYLLIPAEEKQIKTDHPEEINEMDEISFETLYSFYKNPIAWYYKNILNINLDQEDVVLPETELFSLNNLEEWKLKNSWLNEDESEDLSVTLARKKKTGELPLGNFAEATWESIKEQAEPVKEKYDQIRKGYEPVSENFAIMLENSITLTGNLEPVFNDKIPVPCFSKKENKYRFKAYLYQLISCATDSHRKTVFISNERNVEANYISRERAMKQLNVLVRYFREGCKKILPFFMNMSFETEKIDDLKLKKLTDYATPGEHNKVDEYTKRELDNGYFYSDEVLEENKKITKEVLTEFKAIFP